MSRSETPVHAARTLSRIAAYGTALVSLSALFTAASPIAAAQPRRTKGVRRPVRRQRRRRDRHRQQPGNQDDSDSNRPARPGDHPRQQVGLRQQRRRLGGLGHQHRHRRGDQEHRRRHDAARPGDNPRRQPGPGRRLRHRSGRGHRHQHQPGHLAGTGAAAAQPGHHRRRTDGRTPPVRRQAPRRWPSSTSRVAPRQDPSHSTTPRAR